MGDKKDALPFLRHAHPRRVEQKYLHRIPGIVKSLHDLVDPALGVSQDDPLYILCDHNLRLQPLRCRYEIKEQVIQPLLRLPFPEYFFRIPAFFPDSGCGKHGAGRRTVQNIQME